MAAIKIRSATTADLDAISRIHYDALGAYHDFYAAFFKKHPREIVPESTRRAFAEPSFTFLVAEENTPNSPEILLGFIRYGVVRSRIEDAAEEKIDAAPLQPSLFARKEHIEPIWEKFSEREKEMDACYEEAVAGQRHFCKPRLCYGQ